MGRRSNAARSRRRRTESAQATVEFALVLPVLILVMWLGVESVLLMRDQVLVTHAAREAARVAAVGGSASDASAAAVLRSGLSNASDLTVNVSVTSGLADATVKLLERSRLPLLGRIVPSLEVSASVAMRVETPG